MEQGGKISIHCTERFLLTPQYFLACIFVNKHLLHNSEGGNIIFLLTKIPLMESM